MRVVYFEFDVDSSSGVIEAYAAERESDFMAGNFGFASVLLDALKRHNNEAPVLISSSIQAVLDNPYGLSDTKSRII